MKNGHAEAPTKTTIDPKWHHKLLQDIVYTNVRIWAEAVNREERLRNNAIADIYFSWLGWEWIIEIKTTLKFSIFEDAISKYRTQCDYLIIAAPPNELDKLQSNDELAWAEPIFDKIGLLDVSPKGLILRKAPEPLKKRTPPANLS